MSASPLFSIDTHALFWFEMGLPYLSDAVLGVFDDAAKGLETPRPTPPAKQARLSRPAAWPSRSGSYQPAALARALAMALPDSTYPSLALRARKVFRPGVVVFGEESQGLALLYIHPIVLAESYYVLRKSRLEGDYPAYLSAIEANPLYRIEPLLTEDLRRFHDFPEIPEMHDRLIAIQAVRLGAVVCW